MNFKFLLFLVTGLLFCQCNEPIATNKSIQSLPIKEKKIITYDYDTTVWTDIRFVDTSIVLDLKYATTDNFVKEQMYPCGRCFLRPEVTRVILKAHAILQKKGLGLKLFDCYRPKPIQEKLWKKVPNANYVTPPWKGSMHNRGAAVDLTIVDADGEELDMGTSYDYFGKEAHHTFTNHSAEVTKNRALLKDLMESLDLKSIRTEWWHYSYRKQQYEISEMQWSCPDSQ